MREWEAREPFDALWGQKRPSPGTRPGVLQDPGPQMGAVTVGYVAAPVPHLAPPVLAGGDGLDGSALHFHPAGGSRAGVRGGGGCGGGEGGGGREALAGGAACGAGGGGVGRAGGRGHRQDLLPQRPRQSHLLDPPCCLVFFFGREAQEEEEEETEKEEEVEDEVEYIFYVTLLAVS